MQISENLPRFDVATLIIVSGGQAADVYVANEKEITKEAEIKIENPEYSDREGHFKRGGQGKTYGSGSVHEENDTIVKKDFYHALKDELKTITNNNAIDSVTLTVPAQDKNELKDKLPSDLKNKISLEINGNFVGDHINDILERIQENS